MNKSRKYTICAPDSMSDKLEKTYHELIAIDSNFSRLIQCLLNSIISTSKYISGQRKNFRHYNWHIVIQDKENGQYYSTMKEFKP